MSRTSLVLGAACGFLLGVLVVVAFDGEDEPGFVTRERTVTVVQTTSTTGGTVIVKTVVPELVGQRLDVAKDRLDRAGFEADVEGGGILGIIRESNWEVVTQDPGPGVLLEQGSSVHVRVERR